MSWAFTTPIGYEDEANSEVPPSESAVRTENVIRGNVFEISDIQESRN